MFSYSHGEHSLLFHSRRSTMFKRSNLIYFLCVFTISSVSLVYASGQEQANLAQMKKFYTEVVNKGNYELMDQLCTPDFIEHEELPGVEQNLDGVKQFFKMYRAAFPDLKFEIEQMFAKDDKVVTYITITGTHKGEFMGNPATGNRINMKGIDIVRFVGGKAAEHWGVTDTMTMMNQIGAIPGEAHHK